MWGSARRTRRCDSLRELAGFLRLMRSVVLTRTNVFHRFTARKPAVMPRMSYPYITVDRLETSTSSDAREERERQLARAAQIRRVGRRWAVPSQTRASERYLVDVEDAACTCPDFELRRGTCKHQHAVLFWIAWGRDVGEDGSVTETVTIKRTVQRKTYRQKDWRAYDASQTRRRSSDKRWR